MLNDSFKVPYNSLDMNSVRFKGMLHKLTYLVNIIGNVRSGDGNVIQRTHNRPIHVGIK